MLCKELCGYMPVSIEGRVVCALAYIKQYGAIDGGHHKAWLIDQILRSLLEDGYDAFIGHHFRDTGWDCGIAP